MRAAVEEKSRKMMKMADLYIMDKLYNSTPTIN